MKTLRLGRVIFAAAAGDLPGDLQIFGVRVFSRYGEVGTQLSLLGGHVWLIFMLHKRAVAPSLN